MSTSASGTIDRDRKEFTARKWSFHDAVNLDPNLTALDLRVSWLLLSKYLNSETGTAWPAAKTLAEQLGVDERSVRRSIRRLEKVGWWRILHRGGRGRPNKYAPGWDHAKEHHSISPEDPDQPVTETHTNPAKTLTEKSKSRTDGPENPDRTVRGLPLRNPTNEPLSASLPAAGTSEPETAGILIVPAHLEDRTQPNRSCQSGLRSGSDHFETPEPSMNVAEQDLGNDPKAQGTRDAVPRETGHASSATATWSGAFPAIKAEIGDRDFRAWLWDIVPLKDDGKTLVLGAASRVIAEHVKAKYGEVVERHTGRQVEVCVHNPSVDETSKRLAKRDREAAASRVAHAQTTRKGKTDSDE